MAKKSKKDVEAEIAALEAEIEAAGESEDVEVPDPPAPEPQPVEAAPAPKIATILLEGGSRAEVQSDQFRLARVQGVTGEWYDHCQDAPDGEWIYRPI